MLEQQLKDAALIIRDIVKDPVILRSEMEALEKDCLAGKCAGLARVHKPREEMEDADKNKSFKRAKNEDDDNNHEDDKNKKLKKRSRLPSPRLPRPKRRRRVVSQKLSSSSVIDISE